MKIKIIVEERGDEIRRLEFAVKTTTAPIAYDCGGAVQLNAKPLEDNERIVLIPVDYIQWQEGRNASGLYGLKDPDPTMDRWYVERILNELLEGGRG